MTRKTVMHRETEVFVVEEKLAPRKEALSWEIFSLAFMELCKENAPVTPTKASEA